MPQVVVVAPMGKVCIICTYCYDYFGRFGTLIFSGLDIWNKCNVPKVFQQ